MKKLGILILCSAVLGSAPLSLRWQSTALPSVRVDTAEARIGRPLTPLSFAGVNRRVHRRAFYRAAGYGYGGYGYRGYGYGAGYGYGGYAGYGAASYPGYGYGAAPGYGYASPPSYGYGGGYSAYAASAPPAYSVPTVVVMMPAAYPAMYMGYPNCGW